LALKNINAECKEENDVLSSHAVNIEMSNNHSKRRRSSISMVALTMQNSHVFAALTIQRFYRAYRARKKVKAKRHWDTLKHAVRPMMKQRVRDLRSVYDNCGLVDPLDWVAVVEVERTHLTNLTFAQQQIVMFIVPLVSVSLWFLIPIAGFEAQWNDSHYVWFLFYFFVWLVSACLFFFPLFQLVVEIPFQLIVLLSIVFSLSLVIVHAIIFFLRGSTAFWDTCLASSIFHFAVTTLGLIEMVTFVVGRVIWKVRRAERKLQGKKDLLLAEIEEGELPTPKSLLKTFHSMSMDETSNAFQKSILRHAASDRDL